jgi:putative endonuclease
MTYVYILKSIGHPRQRYIGVTADLNQRLDYDNTGRCPHTSKFKPWTIVFSEQFENEIDAFKRERQIKGWVKAKKEALIAGNMKELKSLAKRRLF